MCLPPHPQAEPWLQILSAPSSRRQPQPNLLLRGIPPSSWTQEPLLPPGPQRHKDAGRIQERCFSHSIQGRRPEGSLGQNHLLCDIFLPTRLLRRRQPESLTQPVQMQAAKITARPLHMPFRFFNTIKCLHTVWTLETLTALAETQAAAQAFNSFKWHHFLSGLRTSTSSARCRHPPHRLRQGQDWGPARADWPRLILPHFRWLPPEEDAPDTSCTVGTAHDERLQSRRFYFLHFLFQPRSTPTLYKRHFGGMGGVSQATCNC